MQDEPAPPAARPAAHPAAPPVGPDTPPPSGGLATRLAEVVAARLCHDFSSPVGALGNAFEIIDEPEFAAEAAAIAREAVAALRCRLQLVRAAWCGSAGALDTPAIARLAAGLPGARIAVELGHLEPGPFEPAVARILLNLLMLGAESLPSGGTVALAGDVAGGVVLTIAGPRALWPPNLATMLADEAAAWAAVAEPRDLQPPLTALTIRAAGFRLAPLFGDPALPAPLLLTRDTPPSRRRDAS